jgi:hypothetical protein
LNWVVYEKEYLYHRFVTAYADEKDDILRDVMLHITEHAQEWPSDLIRFEEELVQDEELQEVLGSYFSPLLNHVYETLASTFHLAAQKERELEKRVDALYNLLYYASRILEPEYARSVIHSYVDQLLQEYQPTWLPEIFERLRQDERFLTVMGNGYDALIAVVQNAAPKEE